MKPVLAFTIGDPSGIGPETVVAAAADARVRKACVPLLVGWRDGFRRAGLRPGLAPVLDPGVSCRAKPGSSDGQGGRASFEAVRLALTLAERGLVRGIVTAPISKDSWKRAGIPFRDHTEFFRERLGSPEAAMMLMAGGLRAVLATRHMSLRDALRRITPRSVADAARAAHAALRELGLRRPRLGLCALNPHAGEHGLLGQEEGRWLASVARRLRADGLFVDGPMAADAAWSAHRRGFYDGLVALYHDQAMIPLKLFKPFGVVNWTVGLPVMRTSPGHGTAFDIAGKGRADPSATIEAALLAARLASRNRGVR